MKKGIKKGLIFIKNKLVGEEEEVPIIGKMRKCKYIHFRSFLEWLLLSMG